jgi:uncharacterized protein YtpQ (UPF0354 family)
MECKPDMTAHRDAPVPRMVWTPWCRHDRQSRVRMSGVLAVMVAALQLVAVGFARAQAIPTDEPRFTAYVAEQMQKAAGDVAVSIKGPLTLAVGPLQANLDRIYSYCNANAAGCSGEIDTYVKAAADTLRTKTLPPTREALRLVVRTAQYRDEAQRYVAPTTLVPARPLADGLVVMPMLDLPHTIRGLNEKDSAALGLTTKEVYEVATANLRKSLKALMHVAKPVGRGQIGQLTGDVYQPSRLVLLDSWARLAQAQGGVLIVAAPATDTVLYIAEDSPIAIDALRTLVKNVLGRAPNKLTSLLLRWTPTGWQVVP